MDESELKEQKISSKEVYNGVLLHAFSDKVRLPNGHTSTREWIKHPGASAVVPIFENGDVMLIKQFRYPLRKVFYEVPAGKIDPGETAAAAATRELKEETGIIFKNLYSLGQYHPTIGYSNEVINLYVAQNVKITKQGCDEDEFITPQKIPFSNAVEMAYSGELTDGKTIAALLRAKYFLDNKAI